MKDSVANSHEFNILSHNLKPPVAGWAELEIRFLGKTATCPPLEYLTNLVKNPRSDGAEQFHTHLRDGCKYCSARWTGVVAASSASAEALQPSRVNWLEGPTSIPVDSSQHSTIIELPDDERRTAVHQARSGLGHALELVGLDAAHEEAFSEYLLQSKEGPQGPSLVHWLGGFANKLGYSSLPRTPASDHEWLSVVDQCASNAQVAGGLDVERRRFITLLGLQLSI